jgi:hypothetical protein
MQKFYTFLLCFFCIFSTIAQNIGIGTSSPLMKMHVAGSNSNIALFENTQTLSVNSNVSIYFKQGSGSGYYTGAIKTVGEGSSAARIGLFTQSSTTSTGLLERLTITNDGKVGIGTTNPQAALDISSTTTGFLPPRLDSTQRNAIPSPPAGLTIYNTSINAYECFNGTQWLGFGSGNGSAHFIGEYYGGGIVFYTYDNGQHGLIAATTDQSASMIWYNSTFKNTGTTGDGFGAGAMNTAMLVAGQIGDNSSGTFAAKICADYSVSINGITYGDWYLPSKYELNLLYAQKNVVGNLENDFYWSSTEYDYTDAWYQLFGFGNQHHYGKNYPVHVRAIRAF